MPAGYRANKKQALAHKAFMVDGYKRGVLMWGRQSGKTFFATQHAWISAVKDQGRYFVVFKTYKQAHEVVWRQYIPLIPKELIYKTNEQDLLIELHYMEDVTMVLPGIGPVKINHDKNQPRSTIQLLGSDQSDSHRGFKGHGMIFDEYADQDPNNWDAVYKHFFTTTDGWAIFMGTPRGYNHFYDLVQFAQEDKRWFYLESTWRDSPYVKKEFIDAERAEATKKGTLSTFLQEVELEFRSVQGAVYPMLDRKVHVKNPSEFPEELTYYGAIDFGWHTTAFLLIGIDKDQNRYIIDEVYGKEETLDNVIPRIKNLLGDKRLVLIVADSANRDAIEVLGRDFPVIGVNKANDTKGYQLGISLITEKLKPRMQLVGLPKPSAFIGSNCKHLIFELESYRFPEDKPERNPSDVPIKENDHGCFIAGTCIATPTGDRFIENIKAGDYVLTPFGKEKVIAAGSMGVKPIKHYERFIATPDHPILTSKGIAPIDTIRYNSYIWMQENRKSFTLMEYLIAGILTRKKEVRNFILGALLTRSLEARLVTCTEMSGNLTEAQSLRAILSITEKVMTTTQSKLLNLLLEKNMLKDILGEHTKGMRRFLRVLDHLRKNGTLPKLAGNGILNMPEKLGWDDQRWLNSVLFAVENTLLSTLVSANFVLEDVRPQHLEDVEVFNFATPSGMYFANNVLVSNCDAWRYFELQMKFGFAKDDKPLEFELEKMTNQYGLI